MTIARLARIISLHLFSAICLSAGGQASDVVISQIYGGGGNSGAPYKNDFVELYNRTALPIDLSSWSVQYTSASGSTWQVTLLSGLIQPRRYYLVKLGSGGASGVELPAADAIGSTNMSATAGKVALVDSATARSGACPALGVVDFVGYGATANCYETAPTPGLSATTAALRAEGGDLDSDNNSADFVIAAPSPRNSLYNPLPVQLVSFSGSVVGESQILLDWVTISEVNCLGFYVQRKTSEGEEYADLVDGFVTGNGTTLTRHEYNYLDKAATPGNWDYRLKQVDLDGTINYSDGITIESGTTSVSATAPGEYALLQNYPNPFNPTTVIKYTVAGIRDPLPAASGQAAGQGVCDVSLVVCDLLGREVAILVNEPKAPGSYQVGFDGMALASGVYLCRLTAGGHVETRKLVLIR